MEAEQRSGPSTIRTFGQTLAGILVCNAVGGVTSVAIRDDVKTWYPKLDRPAFTPPGELFGPVWTTLYTMMGIALSIVWRARRSTPAANPALALGTIQLILNGLWSFIFFRGRAPGAALVEIGVLLVAIVMTIGAMAKVSRLAALLWLPYLAWTLFAAVLNYSIWKRNR